MYWDKYLLYLCWIFRLNAVVLADSTNDLQDLSSKGASCIAGGSTRSTYYDCHAILNDSNTVYSPEGDTGWLLITLASLAHATHLDITIDNSVGIEKFEFNILLGEEDISDINRVSLEGLRSGKYRLPVFLRQPILTNYITLSWEDVRMPGISHIRVFGKTNRVTKLRITSALCDNLQGEDCPVVIDGSLLTPVHLASDTTLLLTITATFPITHVTLFSNQDRPKSAYTEMSIGADFSNETQIFRFRNQGREDAARWQIISIRTPLNERNATLRLNVRDGSFATVSEVECFHVVKDSALNLSSASHLYRSGGPPEGVTVLDSAIIGHTQQTIPEEISFFASTTKENTQTKHPSPPDMETQTKYTPLSPPSSLQLTELVHSTLHDDDLSRATLSSTDTVLSTAEDDIGTDGGFKLHGSLPSWFWYIMFGVGSVIFVMVVVIVILIASPRRANYAPKQVRPRVILRSISQTSRGVPTATPTHGFFHFTINSTSSVPEPYSGVSDSNTTTFNLARSQQTTSPPQQKNVAATHGMNQNNDPRDELSEFELSDDCFEP